ncbi:MAG TPA: DUF2062 domain-containing protein [Terrimicrobiaceae bacterium]
MKPRQWRRSSVGAYLRYLPRIKHMRGTWLHRKLGDRLFSHEMWQPERARFAAGCAIGVFFSMMPMPFQMLGAALIAFLARVNIPAAIACTWISNPLTTAPFLLAQYKLGSLIIGQAPANEPPVDVLALLSRAPLPLLVGALVSGIIFSFGTYPLALKGWDWFKERFLQPRCEPGRKKISCKNQKSSLV